MKIQFTITKSFILAVSLVANCILIVLTCCNMSNMKVLHKRNEALKKELEVRQNKIDNLCEKFDCNEYGLQMKNIVDYSYNAYKVN